MYISMFDKIILLTKFPPSIHITTHEDLFILTSSFISDSSNLMRELIYSIHIFCQRTFIRTIKMILHFCWARRRSEQQESLCVNSSRANPCFSFNGLIGSGVFLFWKGFQCGTDLPNFVAF
ncbi:unnamed protein product [Moneuplotes crassus]|uniref:Uncharacterized protein n=1 Tax=Euplotes crassus TaxID=5936 RepID=A0AAD1XTK4_EUPCR|nr:unnamed protein product [Moneuplotes crassus]